MGKKMADISEQQVSEEVSEPQQKKRRVLTEKQKEALARGRAKKLELNLMKKQAKQQQPTNPPVSSASEDDGVEERKENEEPKPKKVKKQVKIRPVEDEDLDDELAALSEEDSKESVPDEPPVLRRTKPVYKKDPKPSKPPMYFENVSHGMRGHFFL